MFRDREHVGDWRVEKLCEDGESIEVTTFSGGDARLRAIRYADREYGEFDLVALEPYRRLSEEELPSSELRAIRETVGGWLRSEPC